MWRAGPCPASANSKFKPESVDAVLPTCIGPRHRLGFIGITDISFLLATFQALPDHAYMITSF